MGEVSEFPVRVYYEDTDAGGIVYNANYLKFMERARTEFLRAGDIEQDVLLQAGIAFVVSRTEIDFRSAARFNELLTVLTQVTEVKRASMRFSQQIQPIPLPLALKWQKPGISASPPAHLLRLPAV